MDLRLVSIIIAFVLYLSMMIIIGLFYAKKNSSSGDFFLGGRKVGPWMTALSAEASDMSGWLLMGLPGLAYLGGMKEAFWTALGLVIGTYLNWLIVAKPLRKCTIAFGDSITIPEFLTNRFKDKGRILATISVIFIVLFFTIYTASGFVACAKLFNSVFGMNYHVGLVIGLIVILAYTIMGGYLAVCATDFVQGTLMFIALVIAGIVMTVVLGGPADAMAAVTAFGERAMSGEFGEAMKAKFLANQNYGPMAIVSALVWGLGYFGMPHILVRFMGLRSNKDVALSRRIATVWVIIALAGALLVGSLGTVYLPQILSPVAAETVFSATIQKMFPAFIAGIFLCAILAAAMSTADSQLLVASSAFSRDIFKGLIKKDASEKQVLNMSRIAVLLIAAVAFVLALDETSSVFSLVSYAWAGFGATFGPLILLALFWRKATAKGAIAGLVTGGITVIVWHNLKGGIFDVYEILPAFILCLVAAVVVSLLDKNKDEQMLAEFDAYKKLED
ncbi:MAG: sodium/proline symporter PutP [Spirochaetaceae bacterium]|nr:sodium/proline symporter PutP [Spirochaetaceae bacterium]